MNSSVFAVKFAGYLLSDTCLTLYNYKFLAHSIKSLTDLKKRLGLRFTKIRKRPVIGERKCRLCLADVRGEK